MAGSHAPAALRERLDSSDPVALIDVRPSLAYVEGHILESTWVPRRELERRLPELVPNRSTPIVLCDDHGERSVTDARWLEALGYETVDYLDGGVEAWAAAGYDLVEADGDVHATAFNYESKAFGEQVAATRDLPTISPDDLEERRDDVTVIDVRNPPEYERWGTIPGSVNVEGFDLPLYVEAVREDDEPVVVHCAGRTRSIIGTATLQALGIDNVYELENGTMGWQLAGKELAAGPGRPDDATVDPDRRDRLRKTARELLADTDVSMLSPADLDRLEESAADEDVVYRFDVRTEPEFADGHLPGSTHVAGGQLVQTAGRHIAVRDAEIVVISETDVRAGITAYWLDRMGFENVHVLAGGTTAWTEDGRSLVTEDDVEPLGGDIVARSVEYVSPATLSDTIDERTVVHVGDYDAYTDGHVPGSWWAPRYELGDVLTDDLSGADDDAESGRTTDVVLTCETGTVADRAGAQLVHSGRIETVTVLDGGVEAWRAADLPIAEGDADRVLREPRRATRKPYAQGDREMDQYLRWEEGLVE
ncbi:3-mercaptopyruvate sulfurtransferase SseA, contains two rhodanese domains [Halopenitus malekzadehii]|uniref:3-mercaptopyruvate sulfurtransferase SseA, contains two rhodanese domains n=1 Tax=Halopenitus malekzadehii TaxID=1267564 RepID=A0A1H6ITR2_9EURY|nr:rhodanese-like domain-containing protein [Halopenitus malekzadehii]SEH50092.1 3-mercaptopyruvate sulfurtransferase SseA, contains two rhodanese domains [Halopenitus malekzadehii]